MGVMAWVAGWMPLLCIIASVILYKWLKNAWIPSLVVLVIPAIVMIVWLGLSFWPWLLLYLFASWIACWATQQVANLRGRRQPERRHSQPRA